MRFVRVGGNGLFSLYGLEGELALWQNLQVNVAACIFLSEFYELFLSLAAFCLEENGVYAACHAFGVEIAVYLLHVFLQSAEYVLALHVCVVNGLYVGDIDDGVVERR